MTVVLRCFGSCGCRRELALTTTGEGLLQDSHRWQRAKFLELTAGWSVGDRTRFATYLERLAQEVGA